MGLFYLNGKMYTTEEIMEIIDMYDWYRFLQRFVQKDAHFLVWEIIYRIK